MKKINFVLLGVGMLFAYNLFANSMFSLPEPSSDNKKQEPMTITSNSMDIDFKNNLITLIGNVVVDDKSTNITSDKMLIYLQDKKKKSQDSEDSGMSGKEAKFIVALGDVVVIQRNIAKNGTKDGIRKTTAGRADYNTENGIIVLTENPIIYENNSYIKGDRITLWKDSDRMKVESGSSTNNSSIVMLNQNDNSTADTSSQE
ncbi:MAG TPA: hypothetical protein DD381_04160 [Lentisphaeria bacterium]|nr:MAG: hypothetical protein A2X47_06470 [Lentisphaerae bacterium GWF2_38_69]HBM15525.1 hypothetical protein [Lentisphaeria bacterium]